MEKIRKASTVILCFVKGVRCRHGLPHTMLFRVLKEYLQDVSNKCEYFKCQLPFEGFGNYFYIMLKL